jgi:dihydrofolate reductase
MSRGHRSSGGPDRASSPVPLPNLEIHGASTAQQALEAGVLDEIQLHLVPVLFGQGRRLFDVLPEQIELDVIRAVHTPEATRIRYRVHR